MLHRGVLHLGVLQLGVLQGVDDVRIQVRVHTPHPPAVAVVLTADQLLQRRSAAVRADEADDARS